MKHLVLAASLALTLAPAIAHAAPPVITGSQPRGLVASPEGPGSYATITVSGTDLALPSTTGATITTDVIRYALWDGTWYRAGEGWLNTAGWTTTSMGFQVPPLRHAGDLVLAVCTRGEGCATTTVPVRGPADGLPVFTELHYRRAVLDPSVLSTDPRWMIRVLLRNLDNAPDTGFWGLSTSVAWMDAYEGVIDLWVRNNIAGRYHLWVYNRLGWSRDATVDLIERPVLTSRSPDVVRTLPSALQLSFRDEFSAPESPWAHYDVPGCGASWVLMTQTGPAAWSVPLPTTCRAWYASYDATLTVDNLGGATTITIPVRPVTVSSPGGGGWGGWPF